MHGDMLKFFRSGSSTLLVKGEPGSGKTSFALTLASQARPSRVFYLSTRVSEEELFAQFPWIKDERMPLSVVDLRLGTAQLLLEKFMGALKSEDSVVILDSWDAFAELLEPSERLKTEGAMVSLTSNRASSSRVVFVSERTATTKLDYMVDAVVALKSETFGGRTLRRIELVKIRGSEITQRELLFTLKGARASVFSPYRDPDYSKAAKIRPPIGDGGYEFSLGSAVLDSAFGTLRRGSVFVVEYESLVPYSALRLVVTPPQVNFVNLGRGGLTIPLFGSEMRSFEGTFRSMFLDAESQSKHLVLFGGGEEESYDCQRLLSTFEQRADAVRKQSADGLVMKVISVARLEKMCLLDTPQLMQALGRIIDHAQGKGDVLIFYLPSESAARDMLRAAATKHVRFAVVDGVVLAWGEKPFTPLYVIEPDTNNPFLPSLKPIV